MPRRSGRTRGAVEEPAPEPEEIHEQEELEAQEPETEDAKEMEVDPIPETATEQNTEQFPALKFNEELSWRPGKPIPIATLLKRLEKLSQELADFEQEETNLKSIRPVAHKLIHRNLIQHKDKGVKAYTACCLVDILRLFVPEAPFDNDELKVCTLPGKTRNDTKDDSFFLDYLSRTYFLRFTIHPTLTIHNTSMFLCL